MAKKDFTNEATQRVFDSIAKATTDPGPTESFQPKKDRNNPGVGFSMLLPADIYNYLAIMSSIAGESKNAFVARLLERHKAEHEDLYKMALEIKSKI